MTMPAGKQKQDIGGAWAGLKRQGKKFLGRFAFEMFIEEFYPQLIATIKTSLAGLTPADIKDMIRKGEFPELPPEVYANLHGYEDYLESITVQRLWKALIEGCPDLATAVDQVGDPGYRWFIRFRSRILRGIRAGAPLITAGETNVEMVSVKCDSCQKEWVVKKSEAANIKECIFCKAPAGGAAPETPTPQPEDTDLS